MNELALDFHGVAVRVSGGPPEVIEDLRRDFEYFLAPETAEGPIRLTLEQGPVGEPPRGRPLFRTRDYAVFDRGSRRSIVYPDPARAEYDFAAKAGAIRCPDPERLRELAYLAVLSRAGEELDRRGLHRVHALGFTRNGSAGLLLLPSGGGKSVTALELLRATDMGLVSDDTPLLSRDLRLMAFPLRMGFAPSADLSGVPANLLRRMRRRRYGPKTLVDLGFFRERVRCGLPLAWLIVGERPGGGMPSIGPTSRTAAAAALLKHLVVGAGIAQMAEYMIRPAPVDIPVLARIAFSRLRTAASTLAHARCLRFILGDDPKANAETLGSYLGSS